MADGKPAVPVIRSNDVRDVEGALNAIRERLRKLDAEAASLARQVTILQNAGSGSLSSILAQLAILQAAIAGAAFIALQTLVEIGPDGIVIRSGSNLITRTLEAGSNVTIENGDGVDGNMVISSTGGGDVVLYDNFGQAMLTGEGQALLVGI